MGLKVHDNGFVEIKTKKDAIEAMARFRDLQAEIQELKEESGLNDLEKDAVAYKAAAQSYMIDAGLDHLPGDGFHGTLVKGSGASHWIATDDDLTGNEPARCQSLQSIIEKKFKSSIKAKGSKARKVWMKITKRVIDPDAVEEAVNAKLLSVDEIAPAWYETTRAPYLRIFED